MEQFPHVYRVSASGRSSGNLAVVGDGLPDIAAAPPAEFDGPGDQWSPETLLTSAIASCFILSFRAVAKASTFEWNAIECETEGTLDRVDRTTKFTNVLNRVTLTVPTGADTDQAEKLLHKAESVCLVSNSLSADVELDVTIRHAD